MHIACIDYMASWTFQLATAVKLQVNSAVLLLDFISSLPSTVVPSTSSRQAGKEQQRRAIYVAAHVERGAYTFIQKLVVPHQTRSLQTIFMPGLTTSCIPVFNW